MEDGSHAAVSKRGAMPGWGGPIDFDGAFAVRVGDSNSVRRSRSVHGDVKKSLRDRGGVRRSGSGGAH